MERNHIRSLILGIMGCLMLGAYGIDYELQYETLFINNKTKNDLVIRFCNEDHNEQQQYPIKALEHRPVRVKIGVMHKLATVTVTAYIPVTMEDQEKEKKSEGEPKKNKKTKKKKTMRKKVVKEIDYDKDADIVGLEITMHPGLDLIWRHSDEYVVNVPSEG